MDVYHIWFNLKDGVGDIPFAESAPPISTI
jgi:hypothetical protein